MVIKFFVLLFAIFLTIYFLNYKFSQSIRILAFNEEEPKSEAIMAYILMYVIAILWAIYFGIL